MFISDKLVYIQLQKTGCSQVARLLARTVGGRQVGKHNPAGQALLESPRLFVSSIRNPWEWYVSLWSYGCDGKGGFFNTVTRRRPWRLYHPNSPFAPVRLIFREAVKNTAAWKKCYADATDPGLFREWLAMVFDPAFSFDFGEGYGGSPVCPLAGLYTYRYLKLCCRNTRSRALEKFVSAEDLRRFDEDNCYIDRWIRNESLARDFIEIVSAAGEKLDPRQRRLILSARKMNVSSRSGQTAAYYDDASAALVREKEALIVEKFGYAL